MPQRFYYQENSMEREFSVFDFINDNHPKYVILLDKEDYSRKGIKHINAIEFLLKMIFNYKFNVLSFIRKFKPLFKNSGLNVIIL